MAVHSEIELELEFGNVGFLGEGKTGVPGEKPLGVEQSLGIEPGTHWCEASALTTAPTLLLLQECQIPMLPLCFVSP